MTTAPHSEQSTERPTLTLVKDDAEPAIEGTVVAHQGETTRPAWLTAVYDHARDHRLYAPQIGRGYLNIVRRWFDDYRDGWPQQIATAKADLKTAKGDSTAEARARDLLQQLRSDYRRHRLIHLGKSSGWAMTASVGTLLGAATGGILFDLGLALTALGLGAWNGRPAAVAAAAINSGHAQPGALDPLGHAPDQQHDEAELRAALSAAGFNNAIRIIDATPVRADGSREITFDLGGATTVTDLRKKIESIAAALKRDVTMVDITKGDHLGQARLWLANGDPFESARRSPLLAQNTPLDSWTNGIPVAYGKRGNTIRIPLINQNAVIGGRSRSGKGVGASNLIVGAAMDPLVNLRIVAGKHNGEWDPYARAGIASTYFKPSPERLLALLKGLLADKDRRERDLGKLAKSKLIHNLIAKIGGIEVLVIDELATYTRPGKPLRDEILAAIEELSQVALGAGILMVLITQYPEVDVLPQAISMNCGTKWAMLVENATQSNAILGSGQAGAGRDASKFDPPRPGLGWLVDPFAGVTDLARSFDLDEDERGEVTSLLQRAATFRQTAERLVGQWDDPIEKYLLDVTGLSSAAGGPKRDGAPGRAVHEMTEAQRDQVGALQGALMAMDHFGRDEAQLDEMAGFIAHGVTPDELGELLRKAGAGGTVKITVPHKAGRVNGYRRADLEDALSFLKGA
ncbi:hypothetical protein [Streptomyces showdoensis]|uniref:hypothetical protein n=1 Tax=Streptomyces showdoensis TaxID=68268 RepID=UPI000F4D68CA|nr:hypothetical protein [Streptomyces showdoensis]